MPYDVVAFEADELAHGLDPYQEGIFHRLLRRSWMNGSIPADPDALADLCRVRPSSFKKAWIQVSKLWVAMPSDPMRLQNKKQESERIFLESKRDQAREAGKLSAKAREIKKQESTDAERTLNDRSTPLPIPTQPNPTIGKGEEKPLAISSPMVPKYSLEFELFWGNSTQRGSKFDASKAWLKLKPDLPLQTRIIAGMTVWQSSPQWQDETKQPHVATWLNRRGWEELVPKSNGTRPNGNGANHREPTEAERAEARRYWAEQGIK